MAKKEIEVGMPIQVEMPTIKKRVTCPKCGAEMDVEFEVELAPLIPALTKDLPAMGMQGMKTEKEGNDKD